MTAHDAGSSEPATRFSAVLTPHRSLGRRGFLIVMILIAAVSFAAGVGFMMLGAWPVVGYFGLDAILIYWAFRRNFSDARLYEQVDLTDSELVVRRVMKGAEPQEWRFIPYWVRVELVEHEALETCGPLYLASHGRKLQIGSFLSPDERRSFATALTRALAA